LTEKKHVFRPTAFKNGFRAFRQERFPTPKPEAHLFCPKLFRFRFRVFPKNAKIAEYRKTVGVPSVAKKILTTKIGNFSGKVFFRKNEKRSGGHFRCFPESFFFFASETKKSGKLVIRVEPSFEHDRTMAVFGRFSRKRLS
jgi:hypothetical protein